LFALSNLFNLQTSIRRSVTAFYNGALI
jgi:hypothetical protein